ncbi:SPFH domain-containing protein [Xenophilus arseniciresistens]|uniref:SPFH domain-containing protein n=1 Tax=Xenophilus arseniciresistens TaxID=1283306 RepID=A0AAE3N9C3_9BURK|nr:SPFH domain-containing protein [Xenophilus arseniciresistens]MDA7417348.1 SPFH domain-containing protein [Xenophilus arseniciresistens]
MQERSKNSLSGIALLVIVALVVLAGLYVFLVRREPLGLAGGVAGAVLFFVVVKGLYTLQPNQAAVLELFGKYVGTVKQTGLRWNNPFFGQRKISLRVRNFESGVLKVNDLEGSPIEIAAVIVWEVVDASEAVYNVDDYEDFVHVQSEAALRTLATSYPYDGTEEGVISLRGHAAEISEHLQTELAERLGNAGVRVREARISHLAYAPEVAQAMLQRQQANAVIAARTRIVAGAVGMVEMALAELQKGGMVQLNEEHKAQMVSNLLVVLCSDRGSQPVVNAGGSLKG